ncbi:Eco57I restriction-modification methylase domain-containing protein [Anaerophaga thermohalophila]|uniref:Eco57I restriction-modification methylase domain-containing protein n=1 Tax=Anaerophaga thermohalophila TaxID=177400 RepID=UPI0002E605A9|nr:TaqI-like C-terminal specificity domain-containing protein [Anaerophaga thermohalophila]
MKLYEAKNIITEVFENPFDKDKFSYFIRNLLKNMQKAEFLRTGYNIPKAFEDFIASYERLGKYEDEEGNLIDVLIIKLKRDHSIDYARSTQRNFVRWYLNDKGKDAALVAFTTEKSSEWRFSFIKMQYSLEKKKDELTPAKRSSFMVGESGKSHTAQRQLIDLLKNDHAPYLSDIEDAFSIEAVSDEFYEKYKALLFNLVDEIENVVKRDKTVKDEFESKEISILNFSKKLLGQIVFLYFLQKKGWLGLEEKEKYGEGDKNFLRSLFNKTKKGENFFNDYLEYLFYDALSKKRVTDYYERFKTRIPFLNGGLFDPIEFYDWQKTDIVISNEIFSNRKGDEEGTGILDVFDLYNFTVKEDEPLETEVAIDPEMLGKVFERMLDVTERKSKGAFYTPREIVHYMAQQSLLYFLVSQASSLGISNENDWKADLETFIHYGEHIIDKDIAVAEGKLKNTAENKKIPDSIKQHANAIDKALEDIKICDPAVGSGAFPVGIMNEIVKLRKLLTPFIVSQASSLGKTNQDDRNTLPNQDDWGTIYFDKNAETEIHERDLPHWSQKGVAYFVTFRLADSIPDSAKAKIKRDRENWLSRYKIKDTSELKKLPKQARIEYHKLFSKRYDELLDKGYGSCVLAQPEIKELVEKALKHFEGKRYFLDEFIVMPNHVHVIVIPKGDWTLDKITHSWKSFTANEINKITGNSGQVWMHESFDHIIRSEKQLHKIRQYIKDNPKVSHTSSMGMGDGSQAFGLRESNQGNWNPLPNQDDWDTQRSAYRFKLNAIQNSIYGVDIDAGAVEIAKLRLWLSMVVDEERIDKIEPLPNLEYKIVQGNSLINIPDGTAINDALATEIENLTTAYFHITDKEKKQEQKQIIDTKIQEQLQFVSEMVGYKIDFDFKLFFHEVWKEKGGFDVVIGNPPYVEHKKLKHIAFILKKIYEVYSGSADLSVYFFEKGLKILHHNGNLSFISTNKFFNTGYGKFLRKYLLKHKINSIINFEQVEIFEKVLVSSTVMNISNIKSNQEQKFIYSEFYKEKEWRKEFNKRIEESKQFKQNLFNEKEWNFLESNELKIKNRVEELGQKIKDINGVEIKRGVTTGYDPAFVLSNNVEFENAEVLKPLIKGREIKKFKPLLSDAQLLFIPWHFPLHEEKTINGASELAEEELKANYNDIYLHLINHYDKLNQRNKEETGIRYEWYALQRCAASYYPLFEKDKIVWPLTADKWGFTLDNKKHYLTSGGFFLASEKVSLKYILALLNSNLMEYYFKFIGVMTAGGAYTLKKATIEELPLILKSKTKAFEIIVDYILFLKSQPTDKMSFYFEQLIDGMVYELYFENEIKQAGCNILKYLDDLPEIKDEMPDEEKMKIITKVFNKLYDAASPVRKNLEAMEEVEEVRIIKESLEK